jgi:aspartyl-tRNA(Asn)/glutamyl-tRNA(Gln) amidotransferase subunit C
MDSHEIVTLARLARLSLDAEEIEVFGRQLAEVLAYIEQLQAVAVGDVPEYLPPERPGSKLRPDVVGEMLDVDRALAAAPARRAGHVVVPKFKED